MSNLHAFDVSIAVRGLTRAEVADRIWWFRYDPEHDEQITLPSALPSEDRLAAFVEEKRKEHGLPAFGAGIRYPREY